MIKFGTGGWRAVIGDEFTKANIQILAEAIARKMQDEGVADQGLCIGYDRRFLSRNLLCGHARHWLQMESAAGL